MKNKPKENKKMPSTQCRTSASVKQSKLKPSTNESPQKPDKKASCSSGSPQRHRSGRSGIRARSLSFSDEDEHPIKRRKTSPSKSVGPKCKTGNQHEFLKTTMDKSKSKEQNGKKQKPTIKETQGTSKEKTKRSLEEGSSKTSNCNSSKSKTVTQKKNAPKKHDVNEFIDLWSLATIGKREASLNATMKVNIMYERQISPKKAKPDSNGGIPSSSRGTTNNTNNSSSPSRRPSMSASVKIENENRDKNDKKIKKKTSNKKINEKEIGTTQKRKRKVSPYTIFEDEPAPKSRKGETKKSKAKPKKERKKGSKSLILRHFIGNIIERSPRQASLNAKAIIAMGTEDDIAYECSSRTRIYDWMEVRPVFQNDCRKMIWVTGHGDPKYTNVRMRNSSSQSQDRKLMENGITPVADDSKYDEDINGNLSDSSIHSTVLKTIHEIADPRLLREYLRSQKEDFQGCVDVETCPTPKPVEKVIPHPPSPKSPPSPKKRPVSLTKEQSEKPTEKDGPAVTSPEKPKPFRVATPIPQFPPDQRTTRMAGFVHQPVPQSFYPTVQQTHQQTQPIKVTPYTPNPAYIYQYSTDRQQQNLYMQGNPSPMQYNVENNDLSQRDYQHPSFSFNHMGSLSLGRRGMNPYHQGNAYSPSIHLPVPTLGFNFHAAQYYQPPIQQLQAQQNLSTLQPVPLQQYPLVQQSMLPTHPLVQNLNQFQTYQSGFSPYANINTQHMNQNANCMPPPPPPPASNGSPHKESSNQSHVPSAKSGFHPISPSPTKSVRSFTNPTSQSSPMKPTSMTYIPKHLGDTQAPHFFKEPTHALLNCDSTPGKAKPAFSLPSNNIRPPKQDTSIQVLPLCKKEYESGQSKGKKQTGQSPDDSSSKSIGHFKVLEDSSVSDILHNAHSAMFSTEVPSCNERPYQQYSGSVSASPSPSKAIQPSKLVEGDRNVRFSVSSILDMPAIKVKTEPFGPTCSKGAIQILQGDQNSGRGPGQPGAFLICIPPSNISKPIAKKPLHILSAKSVESCAASQKSDKKSVRESGVKDVLHDPSKVIVIDDSDSSDDEPLAKLVQSKSVRPVSGVKILNPAFSQNKVLDVKSTKITSTTTKVQSKSKSTNTKDMDLQRMNLKPSKTKDSGLNPDTQMQVKHWKEKPEKWPKLGETKGLKNLKKVMKKNTKDSGPEKVQTGDSTNVLIKSNIKTASKKTKSVKGPKLLKKATVGRKSKVDVINQPTCSTVHGWSWIGRGEWKFIPKLSQQREEAVRKRMCYTSMRHTSGEVISVKDCVILQSDGDGSAPYVAKVSALWENTNGDMMFSMLWYYQPEHTSTGRESEDGEQELFASKHREENSVACIDDKCYVLMYNEYCRMEAEAVRQTQGLPLPRWRELIPPLSEEDTKFCRPLPSSTVCLDNIWFSRYDYDFRKKIVRKPKHKKTDLRYRAPSKLVS